MAVATEDDFRPFEFTDNGNPTGYDQELLDGVQKKAVKFDVRQDIIPWTGILPGVTTGKYDAAVTAVPGHARTDENTGLLQSRR